MPNNRPIVPPSSDIGQSVVYSDIKVLKHYITQFINFVLNRSYPQEVI